MKKQEIIEALHIVLEALEGEEVPEKSVEKKPEKVEKKVEDSAEEKVTGELSVTADELREMKYADLKKLASDMGVSAKGKRDEIIARILNEEVEVSVEETKEAKEKDNIIPFPKKDVDYLAMAKEATEDMTLDEIRETLEDLDLDSSGKKKDLIDRIAKAMEEGVIEIEDDEDSEEEEVEETEEVSDMDDSDDDSDDEDDEDEVTENTYFEDFDDGANDPDDIDSEERKKAVVKLQKEIIADYENESLQDSDIDDFLKEHLTEDELEDDYEDADEMDKFAIYCELMKRMINDDGERVPMGEPYEITVDGDTLDYCCGHELEETDEGYVCEVCGNTYEAE